MLVDPDGRKIKGFSINDKGEVEVNRKKATKKSLRAYDEMNKTKTGRKRFKEMVKSKTKIKLKVTDKVLYDNDGRVIHGKTRHSSAKNDDGSYKRATIYISTAKTGNDRFANATDGEMINAIGVHESIHAVDLKQIKLDNPVDGSGWTWETERKPIQYEYRSRTEYNNGDNSKFKDFYEKPNPFIFDTKGNPKPSFHFPIDK
jgi:hypothetical protein